LPIQLNTAKKSLQAKGKDNDDCHRYHRNRRYRYLPAVFQAGTYLPEEGNRSPAYGDHGYPHHYPHPPLERTNGMEEYYSEENSVKRALDALNKTFGVSVFHNEIIDHAETVQRVLRELWRDGSTYGYNYG
jgi:hypothetical protein